MEALSKSYGWTPNEIRGMDMSDIMDYLDIIRTRHKVEQKLIKKQRRGRK